MTFNHWNPNSQARSQSFPWAASKKFSFSQNMQKKIRLQSKRGVLFDVGHGQGAFDWKVAEAAAKQKFWPDIMSTDLHSGNVHGASKDLCYVMSKFYALGMPMTKVGAITNH